MENIFQPYLTKPAQEVIFSRKKGDFAHPDMPVERALHKKQLGMMKN